MLALKTAPGLARYMEPRDLSGYAEYRAGRGIEELARSLDRDPADFITLSSNENPFGPSPNAITAIKQSADKVHRYPKAAHTDLTAKLAATWDVTPAQVWLANGGDGALDYLSRAFLEPDDSVLVPEPGFAYYAMSARFHHGRVETYSLSKGDAFARTAETVLEDYDGERIVYVTSPHNPTGGCFSLEAIEQIAEATADDTLVVVDEAYGEFTTVPSARDLLGRSDIAIIRSFSKAYGLAGVRLGYALVPTAWADVYARVNTPFAASKVACRAGLAALDDDEHVDRTVSTARWAREYLHEHLTARTWASEANFVLAEVGDAAAVTEAMQDRGVIIRDCTSFGLPDCIRITCGTRSETERTVEALNGVFE